MSDLPRSESGKRIPVKLQAVVNQVMIPSFATKHGHAKRIGAAVKSRALGRPRRQVAKPFDRGRVIQRRFGQILAEKVVEDVLTIVHPWTRAYRRRWQ